MLVAKASTAPTGALRSSHLWAPHFKFFMAKRTQRSWASIYLIVGCCSLFSLYLTLIIVLDDLTMGYTHPASLGLPINRKPGSSQSSSSSQRNKQYDPKRPSNYTWGDIYPAKTLCAVPTQWPAKALSSVCTLHGDTPLFVDRTFARTVPTTTGICTEIPSHNGNMGK